MDGKNTRKNEILRTGREGFLEALGGANAGPAIGEKRIKKTWEAEPQIER